MADSASESSFQSDILGWKQINSSFFSTPGFFVGFSAKSSINTESVRSPTSPLDYKLFSSLSNPFSFKSPRSSSQNGHQKRWHCSEVGLGIINSLTNETKPTGEILDSPKGKNIIFGPQVKTNKPTFSRNYYESLDSSMKSNSLPRNYMISLLSKTKISNPQFGCSDVVFKNEVELEPESCKNEVSCLGDSRRPSSSLTSLSQNLDLSYQNVCSENRTAIMSLPPVVGGGSDENFLAIKPSLLPISIGSTHAYVGSLSAREIELSEDYTCIISHGPNPKTTHIFGDCILECCTNEFARFGKKEEQRIELPPPAKCPEGSNPYLSDEFLGFCHSCRKKLEEGSVDIYMYRDEKAFCSFECLSQENFVLEEIEKAVNNSSKSSPHSSCHEDLFLMDMPIAA